MTATTKWNTIDTATSVAPSDTLLLNGSKITTADRLSPTINIKNYGATGDGSTDDLAAIQSAIDAIGHGEVLFPSGTFIVNGSLNINSDYVSLRGLGGRIVQTSSLKPTIKVITKAHFKARDLIMQGVGTDGNWVSTSWNGVCGIWLNNVTNASVQDCFFTNHAGGSICMYSSCSGVLLDNNYCQGMGPSYISTQGNGSDGGILSGGTIGECHDIMITNNRLTQHAFGIVAAFTGSNCVIANNNISHIPGQHGMYITEGMDMLIADNVITDCSLVGMKVQHQLTHDTYNAITITGNTVSRVGNVGVSVNPAGAGVGYYSHNVKINDNNITDCGYGLYISHSKDFQADDNKIQEASIYGVAVLNSSGKLNGTRIAESEYAGINISHNVGRVSVDDLETVDCPRNVSATNSPAWTSAIILTNSGDASYTSLSNVRTRFENYAPKTGTGALIANIYAGPNANLIIDGPLHNETGVDNNFLSDVLYNSVIPSGLDANMANNSIYYSSNQAALCYKSPAGVISTVDLTSV